MWLAGASLLAIVLGSDDANTVVFGTAGGVEYIIPSTGYYDFTVAGANGGGEGGAAPGGNGAVVGGELFFNAGNILDIVVGGGGGSFVFGGDLLFAAGRRRGFLQRARWLLESHPAAIRLVRQVMEAEAGAACLVEAPKALPLRSNRRRRDLSLAVALGRVVISGVDQAGATAAAAVVATMAAEAAAALPAGEAAATSLIEGVAAATRM
jgi:hypothetical protein